MRGALVLVLALAACDDDTSATLLDGPRVIAIVAEPPTIAVDGSARLAIVTAVDGAPATLDAAAWRACAPGTLVVDPVRDCAGDAAAPLALDGEGHALLAARALAARWGITPPATADDPCGRAVVEVPVIVEAELAGARLIARKDVAIGAAPPPRTNPVIARIVGDGERLEDGAVFAAGTRLVLGADIATGSRDLVCVGDEPAPTRPEDVRVVVYPGGGATASDAAFDVVDREGATFAGTVELTLPDRPGRVPLWLVAIDEGGGVGVAHVMLDVR